MSLAHYFLWGYLAIFAFVAFFVYAACVMAGRADRVETARQARKRSAKLTPPLPAAPEITPLPTPEPTNALAISLEREHVQG